MRKKNQRPLPIFSHFSKYFILLLVFLTLISIPDKTRVVEKLVPRKNYYQNPATSLSQTKIKLEPSQPPFDWTVEKVDDQITRISLPPDPRMSTPDELFEAMNNYRKAHNVSILQKSELLCGIAQNRASEQVANGGLDGHAGFEKYGQEQNEFSRMGEVLFGGVQPQYGVHIVEFGWDRSLTGHKEAIQNPSWQYGCGGIAGYYAVFIFGTK